MCTLQAPSPAVDWDKIEGDILCPLCDYNLRGLTESRCPECGYRFDWIDLIDPQRRRHPYLFEHHPQRKVWSFFKTLLAGLRPGKFWRSLNPAQPSHPRRLLLYWILSNLSLLLIPLAMLTFGAIELTAANQSYRARQIVSFNVSNGRNPAWPTRAAQDQFLDNNFPLPPSPRFFNQLWNRHYWQQAQGPAIVITSTLLLWPWLTILVLMIFRISMRRARVRTIHVLRCVLYCSDLVFWMALGTLLLSGVTFAAMLTPAGQGFDYEIMGVTCLLGGVVYLAWFTYRLTVAYQRYLKFDHCFATIFTSQFIAVLAVFTALLTWEAWA
jgi:hypothetical protein